jgi:hypothetical protein
MAAPLFRNVTVPVAAAGDTVAVSTSDPPAVTVELAADSEIDEVTVPVEVPVPLGFCQKSPQPASAAQASEATANRALVQADFRRMVFNRSSLAYRD